MLYNVLIAVAVVSGIGLVCGIVLALASHFMAVKTDEKKEAVRDCLPGVNCGACGYTGCDGYAAALAKGEAEINLCIPGADAVGMNYVKRENEDNKDDGKDKRPFLVLLFVCGDLVFGKVGFGSAVARDGVTQTAALALLKADKYDYSDCEDKKNCADDVFENGRCHDK